MPRTAVRSRRARWALLFCAAAGCKVPEAHDYNLRELHEEDGAHRRMATQLTGTEYLWRYGYSSLLHWGEGTVEGKAPEKIRDPLEHCVEELLLLAEFDTGDERVAAMQVETYARLARIDPWQITRQICLGRLGQAGERLQLAGHPESSEPAGEPATPEALRDVLSPLIRALSGRSEHVEESRFAADCRAVAALRYDDEGIERALAASRGLLGHAKSGAVEEKLMHELVLDIERRTVRLALERGLADQNVHVRAAAVEASVRALGPSVLAQLIPRMARESEPEMPVAILKALRKVGLPAAEPAPDAKIDPREEELALVYKLATEHADDRVRVNAMRALGAVSGAGFESLREEDWQSWWYSRASAAQP